MGSDLDTSVINTKLIFGLTELLKEKGIVTDEELKKMFESIGRAWLEEYNKIKPGR